VLLAQCEATPVRPGLRGDPARFVFCGGELAGQAGVAKLQTGVGGQGEKYDLKEFVPPPVPDGQNFALAPIVASSYAAMIDKTGHEIIPATRM